MDSPRTFRHQRNHIFMLVILLLFMVWSLSPQVIHIGEHWFLSGHMEDPRALSNNSTGSFSADIPLTLKLYHVLRARKLHAQEMLYISRFFILAHKFHNFLIRYIDRHFHDNILSTEICITLWCCLLQGVADAEGLALTEDHGFVFLCLLSAFHPHCPVGDAKTVFICLVEKPVAALLTKPLVYVLTSGNNGVLLHWRTKHMKTCISDKGISNFEMRFL